MHTNYPNVRSKCKNLYRINSRQIQKSTHSSVQSLSHVQLFVTPWTAAGQASLSITNSNSCPLSRWCHPTISSSVVPFSSCLQSFPASGSFPMSQLFASGGQRIRVSASASVLPMNISGLISFRMDWLDLLAVQGTLKSLQHHSSKALFQRLKTRLNVIDAWLFHLHVFRPLHQNGLYEFSEHHHITGRANSMSMMQSMAMMLHKSSLSVGKIFVGFLL